MNIGQLQLFLLYAVLLNYAILLLWFALFSCARDWLYLLHRRWFQLSPESFQAIHCSAMALYKIGILLFNLTPLLALWLLPAP